ncbi:indole-3-glycerol phosphate synthase TrpC [Paludibaculum fermentans]|uniref:Indole-3-glycerol phosphate synthase n=1 Tax=Paludibaculum fermentans TaxID=1473598 RepID=A0A7S7NQC6_PALFE|nr:indole-3-glycerol phosphate synthase TrpC [Paludibaculum fermentans]QOY87856.1 indole-3-glycerol phosphate synthase TrpC [Paludibaculum fermentans]
MSASIPDILARIVEVKRQEVAEKSKLRRSIEQSANFQKGQRRDFRQALLKKQPAIISEIKKASPSKGVLSHDFNPGLQAKQYSEGGAAALSVLTDKQFFQGSLSDLKTARATVFLPVLRKDFTIDEIDVLEAAASGADAILLIAAILSREELQHLRELASRFELSSLVEVHDEEDLDKALESGAEIIGVNNRNLRTFEVSLETSERLAARMPASMLKVAESGIHSRADVERLTASGFHAFLVGEHLMKSNDPTAALKALIG